MTMATITIIAETSVRKTVRKAGHKARRLGATEKVLAEFGATEPIGQFSALANRLCEGYGLPYIPKSIALYVNGKLSWRRSCNMHGDTSLIAVDRSGESVGIVCESDLDDAEFSPLDLAAASEGGDTDGLRGFYSACEFAASIGTGPMLPLGNEDDKGTCDRGPYPCRHAFIPSGSGLPNYREESLRLEYRGREMAEWIRAMGGYIWMSRG
jgi:hypothetical protein